MPGVRRGSCFFQNKSGSGLSDNPDRFFALFAAGPRSRSEQPTRKARRKGGSPKMPQQVLLITAGIAAGAALFFPVRFLCAFLLRQRGLETGMKRGQQWFLLAGMCAAGGLIALRAGISLRALYLLLLLVVAASVAFIDGKHRIIPNELVIAVFALSAAFGALGVISFQIGSSLLGFAVCFAVFLVPCLWKRKIGAGDVKFASAMGFALGLMNSIYAIVCMGAFVLAYILLEQRIPAAQKMKAMIPMGPFLAAALVVVSAI